MPAGSRTRTVELAALPGTGKSTTCNVLASRLGAGHTSVVVSLRRWLRKSRTYWLFSPTVLIRYLPVLRMVEGRKQGPGLHSLIRFLCIVHAESFLAGVEAVVRRKLVIVDEGLVQRGLSLCMRAPAELRKEIWRAYLARVPANRACVVLTCDPEEALRRSAGRPKGLPQILLAPADGEASQTPGPQELAPTYAELAGLLREREHSRKWHFIDVSASGTPEATADALLTQLEALAAPADLAIFVRLKARARQSASDSGATQHLA